MAESKRLEDRDYVKEIEKLSKDIEASAVLRSSLDSKLHELQAELKIARKSAKDAQEAFENIQNQLHDTNETLEMMTL